MTKNAISPTRCEDYPEWFQQIVKQADLAENAPVRGCMTIKPWGFAIWEQIQQHLDRRIKETGHQNAYFPLFVPLSFLEKEATHVEGFAKECAVVTHHRLEEKEGKLVPAAPLEEPYIVRPTSETIIGEAFSRWIASYRDLPLLINQWANVVRWEMRPRVFLRTTEFLWQEGHTAHASEEEARAETLLMLNQYHDFLENVMAIPVIKGEKSSGERFPGAVNTYTLEAMMQDGKALQTCTSHYLGQNFARGSSIRFSDRDGQLVYAYTTSWGMTTRMIGALIMVHGDDDGLRIPPRIAPQQIVILPVIPKKEQEAEVFAYADQLAHHLRAHSFHNALLSVFVDKRDKRGGEKNWEWIKKGVPLRIEVGPRDIAKQAVLMARRDRAHTEKEEISFSQSATRAIASLEQIQQNYYAEACAYQEAHMQTGIATFTDLKAFFAAHTGFVKAKWSGDEASEALLKELNVTIRCLPLQQSGTSGRCILTGAPATLDAIFAKSY